MLDKVITWIMIFYLLLMLGFFSFETNNSKEEDTRTAILRLIVAFCVILLLVEVALVIKWMVYWAMISFGLMALATRTIDPVEWTRDDLSWDTTIARNLVVTFLIITEIMTVLVHLFTHKVYPYLVRQGKLSETNWWKIHRCTSQSNTLFYTSKARFLSDVRYRIQYCGGLDDQKRPHGYGIWTDTNVHGEHLAGQWEHGVPVGPFRSHEHGSGYSFVNLRIGFCTNRAEIKGTDNYFWPKHAPDGIRWGVASVECSVSGGFFRFLPIVTHLTSDEKEKAPQNAAECLPYLRTPVDYVVYSQVEEENKSHQINSSYTTKRSRHLYRENSCPIVEFPVIEEEKEALVLIHGYNCCLDYAINRLGQFPAFIHPFVFSWPSAGLFAAFDAVKTGAESEATGQHLQFFFKSLAQAGYKKINVITHSMGARVFFNSLQRGFFDEVFLVSKVNDN
jgi:hypothetical protein